MTDSLRAIAALASACRRTEGTGRDLLLEDLLCRLATLAPEAASISASILHVRGDQIGQELAAELHDRLADYEGRSMSMFRPTVSVDYLILAVKDVELTACLRAFDVPPGTLPTEFDRGLEAWITEVDGFRYAIAQVGTAGNVESALVLGGLCSMIASRGAILVGMAAGVRDKVKLGDVVLAELVIAYEFQVMRAEGPLYAPRSYAPPEWQIRRATSIGEVDPTWAAVISQDVRKEAELEPWPQDEAEMLDDEWRPKVKRGAVLAGGRLIEDGSLPRLGDDVHGRTLAAEMEGAGFAAACAEAKRPWLVVRGVADYGEENRRRHWQFPATYAAARFVRNALRLRRLNLDT